jgi:hypothetical protein
MFGKFSRIIVNYYGIISPRLYKLKEENQLETVDGFMNWILCNEGCKHQKNGYCCLEGASKITNSLTSSPCCYFEANEGNLLTSHSSKTGKNSKDKKGS